MVAQKRLVQAASAVTAHNVHCLAVAGDFAQRILAAVVHSCRRGHGRRVKGLHLVGAKTVFLQPQRQVHHVFVAGARVGGDKVWNQILLFTGFQTELLKQSFEFVVAANPRLHHLGERALLGMLRRNLQVTANMVGYQFFHVLGALHRQVVAQARTDQNFLDPLERTGTAVDLDQGVVVGTQVGADTGVNAARLAAGGFNLGAFATQAVHIRRGTTQIRNGAGKALHLVADVLHLADDGFLGAALDDAAFVLGDGAKRTAAKTAAHDIDAETDHFPSRYFGYPVVAAVFVRISRVRAAGVGQVEHRIHLCRGQRDRWRIDPYVPGRDAFTVGLHQCTGVARIGFQVQYPVSVGIKYRIGFNLLIRRQADH